MIFFNTNLHILKLKFTSNKAYGLVNCIYKYFIHRLKVTQLEDK